MIQLEFYGAAQTVTGSMHLIHLPDGTVALDCGLFQGRRQWSREMNLSFPFPPRRLRTVLLSHAHIDHSGKIPHLFRYGFDGKIYATSATCDLCDLMLADSAHIQEEDAAYWNKKRAKTEADRIEPLYTVEDARAAAQNFHGVQYGEPVEFADGCTATFIEAGHILGSSCVLVEINRSPKIRLLYTGDLGRFDMPILRNPSNPLPEVDYLITESTYANRRHSDVSGMESELVEIINETREKGGKVIMPSFSVGRTQHLVYWLSQSMADGKLEPLPIFVDSPLSTRVTRVFRDHPECYDEKARDFWHEEGDVFGRGRVTYITDVEKSKALNYLKEPCVIISASGMCEAGRILHHLKNNIEHPRNTVIIVGYQAQSTLGRRIVERRDELKIYGRLYKLRARVEVLNGFSAHADTDDFVRLFAPIAPKLKAAFAVHGEGDQIESMKNILRKAGCSNVLGPTSGQRFPLEDY
jgi:metallo-beta-lactamase family protein